MERHQWGAFMSNRTAQRAIATFLKSRRQLIVELMRLSRAIEGELRGEADGLLERFCQDMVDYLSVGYFRVFCGMASPQTWASPREYAIFDATTSTAMTFNDRHAGGDPIDVSRIKGELAALALALETRFELEDELLNRSATALPIAV
jgi:regulator of sigma D